MSSQMQIGDLINAIEVELSQVPGYGTQLYAQDRIAGIIQRTFDMVYQELWWPSLMQYETITLDGKTGTPVTALAVSEFADIRAVWTVGRDSQLPLLPRHINPYMIVGSTPRYIEGVFGVAGKPFIIWPLTSTMQIIVHERIKPKDFGTTDTVPFDRTYIIYSCAWQYAVDDGSNPATADKFQKLAEARLTQLKKQYAKLPIVLDPRIVRSLDIWTELPP